jgi:hypothetical protein
MTAALNLMTEEEKGPLLFELGKLWTDQSGLTQAIRKILQEEDGFLTVPEIKEVLEHNGYDFSIYKSNPLSSIHSILKRFKPSEVTVRYWTTGSPSYRWKKVQAKKVNKDPRR